MSDENASADTPSPGTTVSDVSQKPLPNDSHNPLERGEESLERFLNEIAGFRKRARVLHYSSIAVLLFIGGLTGLGVLVFVQAGSIVTTDVVQKAESQARIVETVKESAAEQTAKRVKTLLDIAPDIAHNSESAVSLLNAVSQQNESIKQQIVDRFGSVLPTVSDFDEYFRRITGGPAMDYLRGRTPNSSAQQASDYRLVALLQERVREEFGASVLGDFNNLLASAFEKRLRLVFALAANEPAVLTLVEERVRIERALGTIPQQPSTLPKEK